MADEALATPAWLMRSISASGARQGVLILDNERLSFTPAAGSPVFEAPVSDVHNVKFPFYNAGTVMPLDVGTGCYRLTFMLAFAWVRLGGREHSRGTPAGQGLEGGSRRYALKGGGAVPRPFGALA
jgi:hypothetical protein